MAFKLTKDELSEKASIEAKLAAAKSKIEAVYETTNSKIIALNEELDVCHDVYNEILSDAHDFVEKIAEDRRGEFEDKSENWQETERGSSASSWVEEYENALDEFDEMEFSLIPLLPDVDVNHSEVLAEIPSEMEE